MTSATRRRDAANERSRLLTNREHLRAALVGRDRGHDYEHRHRDRKRESYRVNGAIVSHSSYVRRSLSFPRERGAAAKQFPGRARPSTGCAPPPRCAMRAHTHSVRTLKREGVPADWRRQLVAEPVLGVLVPLPSWGRDWVAGSALDRSVALAPLMLDERGRPELCERGPLRIVERPDDRLAVRDRQRKGDSSELNLFALEVRCSPAVNDFHRLATHDESLRPVPAWSPRHEANDVTATQTDPSPTAIASQGSAG
jgi:hypothetical protein